MPTIKERPSRAEFEQRSSEIEERVLRLEKQVAGLKGSNGMKSFLETFAQMPDNETAHEAERLGRAYRRRQPKC